MGLRRFIKKGVTVKRILNLYPVKTFLQAIILPFYKLIIFNSNKGNIFLTFLNSIFANLFNVFPSKFTQINKYLKFYPQCLISERSKNNLIYSKPIFLNSDYSQEIEESKFIRNEKVICFNELIITGGSSVLIQNTDIVIYENSDFDFDKLIHYESDLNIKYSSKYGYLIKNPKVKRVIDRGIWLGGSYSFNYYHFVYEYLIKLIEIDENEIPIEIPIIFDSICLQIPTFKDLIDILNTHKRPIITIDYDECCIVKMLFHISCPNYIPLDFKNVNNIQECDLLFDSYSLLNIRKKLLEQKSSISTPSRFFISRKNSSGKRSFNEDEVFLVLERYGFVKVAPEEYSIKDQIALFNNAEFIIGGSGAAFTNLIFCREHCQVILFQKHNINFSGFSTIAALMNVSLIYFTEEYKGEIKLKDLHNSFCVDTEMLTNYLNGIFNLRNIL